MPFCTFYRKDGWERRVYMADPPPTYRLEDRVYRRSVVSTARHDYDLSPSEIEYREVE